IASFLPLYAEQKDVIGIEGYFLVYALFLMLSRTFAGQIYDKKGHEYVFLPGTAFIFTAMLLLSWLPNTWLCWLRLVYTASDSAVYNQRFKRGQSIRLLLTVK